MKYRNTTIAVVEDTPAANTAAGFEALPFESGDCSLLEVPPLMRVWGTSTDELACDDTDYEEKTSATWAKVPVKFKNIPGDLAQAIYASLESQPDGVGSFRITLPSNGGTFYFTAQVSKFPHFDGGNKNATITRTGELILRSEPVFVAAT